MFKALLHETWTKRDINGNVYHTVRITNPKNGKSFTTETCSIGNVTGILNRIFANSPKYYITEECTMSSRYSSLPKSIYLDECHPSEGWLKALRGIGYRLR